MCTFPGLSEEHTVSSIKIIFFPSADTVRITWGSLSSGIDCYLRMAVWLHVLVIFADAQAPCSHKLLLCPSTLLIVTAHPSPFPCWQKSCHTQEQPRQSPRHSALRPSLARRRGPGGPCRGGWVWGSSMMLWTSPGSPWGSHSLNPDVYPAVGTAAGNICDWDREIFGPQQLSGQILPVVVSETVSDQQWGRFV